jgi:hypothetical protein
MERCIEILDNYEKSQNRLGAAGKVAQPILAVYKKTTNYHKPPRSSDY